MSGWWQQPTWRTAAITPNLFLVTFELHICHQGLQITRFSGPDTRKQSVHHPCTNHNAPSISAQTDWAWMLRNTSCPVCSTKGVSFPAVRQEVHQRGLNMSFLTPVTKSESYWTPGMKHNPADSCFPFRNFPPMISVAECDWWGYHRTLSRFVLLSWSIKNSSSVLKVTIYQ